MILGIKKLKKGDIFLQYQIIDIVAQGGMGTVYKAIDIKMKRIIALKVLSGEADSTLVKRFQREARILAKINHPNIVPVHNAGEHKGILYLVMPLLDAIPIDTYIEKFSLDAKAIVLLVKKICEILDFVHSKGIVHRDLKPSNILVDTNGKLYIIDFGIAKIQNFQEVLTYSQEILGTVHYMSPEQINAKNKTLDKRTDIYSIGIILHVLIAKAFPFDIENKINIIMQIASNQLQISSLLPLKLHSVFYIATRKSPQHRYVSLLKMKNDLEKFCNNRSFGVLHFFKKYQTKLTFATGVFFIALFVFSIYLATNFQSKTENIATEDVTRVIKNLITLELYDEAQLKWNEAKKQEISYDELQLEIWTGKEEYENVWNDKNASINTNIAFLKIKAGYYVNKNIFEDSLIKKYKQKIQNENNPQKIQQVYTYDLFFIYYKQNFHNQKERVIEFWKYYQEHNINVEFLHKDDKTNFSICLIDIYTQMAQMEKKINTAHIETAEKIYKDISIKNGVFFDALKKIIYSLSLIEKKSNNEITKMRKYLSICLRVRPNDGDLLVMLAHTYVDEKSDIAYLYYKKAMEENNIGKALESILELASKDSRYMDECMWLLVGKVKVSQKTNIPNLFTEKIRTIKNKSLKNYYEYHNSKNTPSVNVLELFHTITAKAKDENIQNVAKKALILEGYKQDLEKYFSNIKEPQNLEIIRSIYQQVKYNKQNLLLYFLAEYALFDSHSSIVELEQRVTEIQELFNDERENTIHRYLAAKSLIKLYIWSPVIEGLSQKKDIDLVFICSAVLHEAGFIYDYKEVDVLHPITIDQLALYVQSGFFVIGRIKEYIQNFTKDMSFKNKINTCFSLLSSSDKVMQKIAAYSIRCVSINPEHWKQTEMFINNGAQEDDLTKEYLYYLHWNNARLKENLEIQDIKEFIEELSTQQNSASVKEIMLENISSHQTDELKKIFISNLPLKKKFLDVLTNIALDEEEYFHLRAKTLSKLANLIPYEKEYFDILENTNVPTLMRSTMVVVSIFEQVSMFGGNYQAIIKNPELTKNTMDIMYNGLRKIREKKDESFRNILNKLSFFLGLNNMDFFALSETTYDLKANNLMNFTGDTVIKGSIKLVWDIYIRSFSEYQELLPKQRDAIISEHLRSQDNHLRMSAWATKTFFANNTRAVFENAKDTDDNYQKMGISWGIYRKMSYEIYQEILAYSSSSFKTYQEYHMDELEKNLGDANKRTKYLEYINQCLFLEESLPDENKSLARIVYYLEQRSLLFLFSNEEEKAMQCLEKIERLTPNKEYITEKNSNYLILKARILFLSKEKNEFEIIKVISRCLEEKEHYTLYKIMEIVEYFYKNSSYDDVWQNLYRKSNQKLIFAIQQIESIDNSNEIILYQYVADSHQRLAEIDPNHKKFHLRSREVILKNTKK